MIETVDRRQNLSLEEFQQEYAIPQKPVIITDATRGWKALEWTPEYLARLAPDVTIEAMPTSSTSLRQAVNMSLAEYVEYFQAPDERKLYMINWVFEKDKPELLKDFEVPPYFKEDWLREVDDAPKLLWIFLGPANSGLFMHIDVGHTPAWNVQLSGSKSWKLWSPDQEHFLYNGNVNAFAPDLEEFPDFAKARAIDTVVGPGECIFVPSLWWHQTKNIDAGMALTANYVDRFCHEIVFKELSRHRDFRDLHRNLKRIARERLRN